MGRLCVACCESCRVEKKDIRGIHELVYIKTFDSKSSEFVRQNKPRGPGQIEKRKMIIINRISCGYRVVAERFAAKQEVIAQAKQTEKKSVNVVVVTSNMSF